MPYQHFDLKFFQYGYTKSSEIAPEDVEIYRPNGDASKIVAFDRRTNTPLAIMSLSRAFCYALEGRNQVMRVKLTDAIKSNPNNPQGMAQEVMVAMGLRPALSLQNEQQPIPACRWDD